MSEISKKAFFVFRQGVKGFNWKLYQKPGCYDSVKVATQFILSEWQPKLMKTVEWKWQSWQYITFVDCEDKKRVWHAIFNLESDGWRPQELDRYHPNWGDDFDTFVTRDGDLAVSLMKELNKEVR